jgi:two-component system response regulator HydG
MAGDDEGVSPNEFEHQVPTDTARPSLELQNLQRILDSTVFPGGLIGSSPPITFIHELIAKTIDRDFQVLILGETGTGKELVARSVHFSGTRKHRPFIAVDCSAISTMLFESELFGYVRGAFTGAAQDHKGLFQAAETGTLFLDEIGELPKQLQSKLLRVIQEGEVRRVGSTQTLPVDVRVIAATNRDLQQAVEKGEFREDLYYRLNVFQIVVPPLRQHRLDIPLLVAAFIRKYADPRRPITGVGMDFWTAAMGYAWPGNVRELEHSVARSIALGSGPTLHDEDRCVLLLRRGQNIDLGCAQPLTVVEKKMIWEALRETGGNKPAAALILGIGKTTLYRKMKEYGFSTPITSESF